MTKLNIAIALSVIVAAPAGAKTLTVGVDVSSSNPLFVSVPYANKVAQTVSGRIAALQPGDAVVVRQIGDRSVGNALSESIRITRRMRADKVGARVAAYIAALPSHPEVEQGATNIVGFFTLGQFDCKGGGEIVLATDGIESSEVVGGLSFVMGKTLPPPPKNLLAGCTVTMIGIGQSIGGEITLKQAAHVVDAWTAWMKLAGAAFTPLVNP